MAQHYNYPLTKDRYRFVHYWRNGELTRFHLWKLPYGLGLTGFGWSTIWVLWPREERGKHL